MVLLDNRTGFIENTPHLNYLPRKGVHMVMPIENKDDLIRLRRAHDERKEAARRTTLEITSRKIVKTLLTDTSRYRLTFADATPTPKSDSFLDYLSHRPMPTHDGRLPVVLVGTPSAISALTIKLMENAVILKSPEGQERHIVADSFGVQYDFLYPNPPQLTNRDVPGACRSTDGHDALSEGMRAELAIIFVDVRVYDGQKNAHLGSITVAPVTNQAEPTAL